MRDRIETLMAWGKVMSGGAILFLALFHVIAPTVVGYQSDTNDVIAAAVGAAFAFFITRHLVRRELVSMRD